jgi:ankyrin repeat protein
MPVTPEDRHTLHEIARRGIGDLDTLLRAYTPEEITTELPAAAEIAAKHGHHVMLRKMFHGGLPFACAEPLLRIAIQHRQEWATAVLRYYHELPYAIEALRGGNEEWALRLLAVTTHSEDRVYFVQTFLALGLAPDSRVNGEPLLLLFVRGGDEQMVRLLLDAGASPRVPSASGDNPLAVARSLGCAKALLEYGADPLHPDDSGRSPLEQLVSEKRADPALVDLLLAHVPPEERRSRVRLPPVTGMHAPKNVGGDIVFMVDDHDLPALRQLALTGVPLSLEWACAHGNLEEVRRCLAHGDDPRQRSPHGFSPLQLTVGWTTPSVERREIVALLLKYGVDADEGPSVKAPAPPSVRIGFPLSPPTRSIPTYPSPLILSLMRGLSEIANLLLDAGAKIRIEELQHVQNGMSASIAERLLAQLPPGVAATEFSIRHDLPASFGKIVAATVPDASLVERWARLAIAHDAEGCLSALSDHVPKAGALERTLVHEALKRPSVRCAEYLLRRSPELARGTTDGGTPFLHVAIEARHKALVSTLLRLGADPSMRNAQGQTAFDLRPYVHLVPLGYFDREWPEWFATEADRHRSFFRRFLP